MNGSEEGWKITIFADILVVFVFIYVAITYVQIALNMH